jgi:hypothetical protein
VQRQGDPSRERAGGAGSAAEPERDGAQARRELAAALPGLEAPAPTVAPEQEEPPPLGSWERMYALVLGFLAFLIVVFTLFTKAFE